MATIDRVKFDAPSNDILVWKFPSESLRIGTQLIVNESQEALLYKDGNALDLFGPGRHTLSTGNIPLLMKLINLPFGGNTPFTAEVWYINRTIRRGLKWGTPRPIPIIEPNYNFPISVRAFGQWGIRIKNSRSFITQVVGTLQMTDTETIEEYFGGEIAQHLSVTLTKLFTEGKVSVFEVNAHLDALSTDTINEITPEFSRFGIEIVHFNVERVNIPKEELEQFQEVLGRKMEIEQISKAEVGESYLTMRTLDTLEKAAESEGAAGALIAGGLGIGVGASAAIPLGQQLGQTLNAQQSKAEQPEDSHPEDSVNKLKKLKQMLDEGLITQEDFEIKKKQVLDEI